MRKLFTLLLCFILFSSLVISQTINEFHYDNAGTDVGEFVEVYIPNPQPSDLANYTIVHYNGSSSGGVISSETLDDLTPTCDGDGCYYVWNPSSLQNGPDGLALVGPMGLIEFISYEGVVTAVGGPVPGAVSTDVGVSEGSSTPIGTSISRNSMGDWEAGIIATPGAANTNALPIELFSFAASKKSSDVALNWTTISETNNDYFIIEHSRDGSNFRTIGQVNGAGTTTATQNYSFDHETPAKGSNYYRLQQVDYSRASSYSTVESLMWDESGALEIYPTLINEVTTIVIEKESGTKDILVHDLTGQLLISESTNESGNYELNFAGLAYGTYLVSLRSNSGIQTTKVVKQ